MKRKEYFLSGRKWHDPVSPATDALCPKLSAKADTNAIAPPEGRLSEIELPSAIWYREAIRDPFRTLSAVVFG